MNDSNNYRFFVNEHDGNGEPTVFRARLERVDYGEQWRDYWDGDFTVAFTVDYRWFTLTSQNDSDDADRVIASVKTARDYGQDWEVALKRMAQRITGNWDADFICVSLDRGYDVFALSWDGDPDHVWRDEIEAVHAGNVYRAGVDEYQPGSGPGGSDWIESDWSGEEWYGGAVAQREFDKAYPLAEFPADLFIAETGE